MKITPIEIRQKDFEKAFRGYEKEEVDAFLVSLSQEWEKTNDENKELRRRLDAAEKDVSKLREVENSLYRALKTAEDTGTNMIDQASKSAELHLREAKIKAEALLSDSKSRARAIIEDAEEKASEVIEKLQDEIKAIEQDYIYLETQKDNLLSEIKNLLNDLSDKISRNISKSNKQEVLQKFKDLKNIGFEKTVSPKEEESASRLEEPVQQEIRSDNEGSHKGNSFFDNI